VLAIFRSNQLITSLLLLLYAAALHAGAWFRHRPVQVDAKEGGILYALLQQVLPSEPWLVYVLGVLLLTIQAFFLNLMELRYRLDREAHLFPGVFFLLFTAYSPGFSILSPLHFANLFLFFSLLQAMNLLRKGEVTGNIFNIGFFLALSTLFCPAYIVFVLLSFAVLNVVRGFQIRERAVLVIGFFVVLYLAGGIAYLAGYWKEFVQLQGPHAYGVSHIVPSDSLSFFLVPWGVLLGVFLWQAGLFLRKRTMQEQKRISFWFWMLLVSLATLPLQKNLAIGHALVVALPLAYLSGMWFFHLKANWAELLHFILFSGAFAAQWFLF
jgi:hypothetical protein